MRLIGVYEDDEGNGRYLLRMDGESSRATLLYYDEAAKDVRLVERGAAEALFQEGGLEHCSLPAADVFFPDELERLRVAFTEARS